mmetsp:Transcript_31660/g.72463  ORF Transcript_31660/g.72463 Transcript_31660/m.72463 type:complete len:149 (+) Transcript_31660:45-491(+)
MSDASLRAVSQRVYMQPSAHPVEDIQKNWLRNQIETEHYALGHMYGKHLPMQIRMEVDILSQVQRLPGLPNSNLGIETILGRDDKIDFEDYLGDPRMSEYSVDMRAVMEKRLGLEVRSPIFAGEGVQQRRDGQLPRAGVAQCKQVALL